MLITEKVGSFNIAYDNNFTHSVREYYVYCINLFREQLKYLTGQMNFVFGDINYIFDNGLTTKRIALQFEHTLVRPGGRDSDGFPVGNIPIADGSGNYLVRLCNYDSLSRANIIVEYSIPNIVNVRSIDKFPHYCDKVIHISPCLYDIDFSDHRPLDITTNFYDPNQPRRYKLLQSLAPLGVRNHTGVYDDKLAKLYSASKVLVNIHQTDYHDCLEELRVLPGLRRGCVVIAERSALQDIIPYAEHIVWADYDKIPDMVESVLKYYDDYRNSIFGGPLLNLLRDMEHDNQVTVAEGLKCLI